MSSGEMIIYKKSDGVTEVKLKIVGNTVCLTQLELAELFQTSVSNINKHIKAIIAEHELSEATIEYYSIVQNEGNRQISRKVAHYNLEMILAIGYRVRSKCGTHFRQWATQNLTEYLAKGFIMDDERLKNPPVAGSTTPDYFDEMLVRIRDIRSSEKRMYLRVREIFAMAGDYDPTWSETTKFFSVIQNKLHYAATGKTAAELIQCRADYDQPNMGLTSWKMDELRKTDVTVAKNYLNEIEIEDLNRIVVMWLDFAEDQARRRKQIFIKDWEEKLDSFLVFNDRNVLANAGKVSKKIADEHAHTEYEKFSVERRAEKERLGDVEVMRVLEGVAKRKVDHKKCKGKNK